MGLGGAAWFTKMVSRDEEKGGKRTRDRRAVARWKE